MSEYKRALFNALAAELGIDTTINQGDWRPIDQYQNYCNSHPSSSTPPVVVCRKGSGFFPQTAMFFCGRWEIPGVPATISSNDRHLRFEPTHFKPLDHGGFWDNKPLDKA